MSKPNIKHIWFDFSDKDFLPAKQVGIVTGLLWKESSEADHSFKDFQAILEYVRLLHAF